MLVLGLLPTAALAENETSAASAQETTATVNFTAQAEGAFLCAPQFNVEVSSQEAENFGYTDSVTDGVSALDVLVKAHETIYGDKFTADSKANYLEVSSSGFVTKVFRVETSANGFALNGISPNDGTASSYGGYNGTTVTTQAVVNGDNLEFFAYQDDSYYSDELAWFSQNGLAVDTVTAKPSATVELVLKSSTHMMGYLYENADAMHAAGSIVAGAQLAWVNTADGTLTDIKGAVTDETGKVTLTMPDAEGTSYLTAYMPAEDIEDGESPLILSLTKVVADNNVTEADPCALSSLVVKGYADTGYDQVELALTPAFSPEVLSYTSAERGFRDDFTKKLLMVSLTAVSSDATIKATLNGENEKDFSTQSVQSFSTMVPGQDNVLTITVSHGDGDTKLTKIYTVTVPMAADPAAPKLKGDASVSVSVAENTAYTLDLTTVFEAGNAAIDTYKVSVDGAETEVPDGKYTNTWTATGNHTLVFTAYSGSKASPTYTVHLKVTTSARLVMDNIAAKYAQSGVAGKSDAPWLATDMMAYAKTFPETANQLSAAQKQAMVDEAIGKLETSQAPGDVAKYIIALTAMGYDPANLTTSSGEPLDAAAKLAAIVNEAKTENPTWGDVYQYYTTPYVIIALRQFGNAYQTELDKLVTYAVEHKSDWQSTTWGVDGLTFMIPALAPYYNANEATKTALDEGVEILAQKQNENGTIVGNVYSTGLSAVAFAALGKDPAAVKSAATGKTLVDGLMTFVNSDQNGFSNNEMATEQCFRGLIALANAEEGRPYCLYDFSGQTLVPAAATSWAENCIVNFKTIPGEATVVVKQGENVISYASDHDGYYDLSAGTYTYTISKDGYTTKNGTFTVTVEQAESHEKQTINVSLVAAEPAEPTGTITVTVKVMAPPSDTSKLYTYKHNSGVYENLVTGNASVTVASGTSVRDAMVQVLDANNISYYEKSNGYFPMIGGLEEMARGSNSGWMYLVNGAMPDVAAQDYKLTSASTVTWFYTDDYTNDYGSESWDGTPATSDQTAASNVMGLISAIGTVTKDSGDKIQAARSAYDKLTDAQKKLVSNYNVLTEAEAAFAKLSTGLPFTDIKVSDYYCDAVKWAVEQGITTGTTDTTFSPNEGCTRSQMVTFLWRAAGSPEPTGKTNPFTDVKTDAYYYKALLWAIENGITKGTTETTFSPDETCTRGQMATFLYRNAKSPAVTGSASFTDVETGAYYSDAVAWAFRQGITKGASDTTFAPEATCTRGQMVTFLYRYLAK